jgi:crotonobetainyl-CoA:carnitine CoA-transferase CaiB-like acyl-CoA transferase
LLERNPRLAVITMSAYGADEPDAIGYGPQIEAEAGWRSAVGQAGAGSDYLPLSDPAAGAFAALVAIAAVIDGGGCHVDVSQHRVALELLADILEGPRPCRT